MQGIVGTKLSGALNNCAVTPGRQAFTAAHKCCLCLKDCREGPVIENPGIFIDVNVSPYHPLERASVGQRVGAGEMTGPGQKASAGGSIFCDCYKLLQAEAARKKRPVPGRSER